MKSIGNIIILLLCMSSCLQNTENGNRKILSEKSAAFFNTYRVFDEPGRSAVSKLQFYLLIVSFSNFDSTRIISIRQDSNTVYGYYKLASYRDIPSLQRVIDFDSTSFIYSTIHFKIANSEIDTLKKWTLSSNIAALKDSVNSNHLDGGMKEIILFDGEKVYHIYRSFGSNRELESNLRSYIENVKNKYCLSFPSHSIL